MGPEKFKLKLIEIAQKGKETGDDEEAWCEAHELVCELLEELGYADGAEIFRHLLFYG